MDLIKEDTLAFYKDEHANRSKDKAYGTTGARNAGDQVFALIRSLNRPLTVLDFGAGKQSLGKYVLEMCEVYGLPHKPKWTNYDPAVPGIDQLPTKQFDIVVSSDVLEHIEPDCLDNVIETLDALCARTQFHSIACDPAGLIMPDGRNAHLICERLDWWLDKFGVAGQAEEDNRYNMDKNNTGRWSLMRSEEVLVRKRSYLRRHCVVQLDRRP